MLEEFLMLRLKDFEEVICWALFKFFAETLPRFQRHQCLPR